MYSSLSSYSSFSNNDDIEHYSDSIVVVHEVTDSSISMIYKSPTVLLVYAPWCFHCTQFKPKFTELAQQSKSILPSVSFAQLDATSWPLSANQFSIQGYPTIFLVVNGKTITYEGTRSIPLIQSWISSNLKK